MPVTMHNLDDVFTYHPPNEEQAQCYVAIREGAKQFARIALLNSPTCADQQAAMRDLRRCVHMLNAAVALKGAV